MATLVVYARLYASCLARALGTVRRSPWTLLLPMSLFVALSVAAMLLGRGGLIGGMLLGLAIDALLSCYFYFVSEQVAGAKVRLDELKKSFGVYFWSILNLMFVIWLAELLLAGITRNNPHGDVIDAIVRFGAFVLLNPAPEVLYTRGTYGGLATLHGSIQFIHENWIEWFVPNLALGAAFYFGLPVLASAGVPDIVASILAGALLHVVMVFRGYLFRELDGSSHRQRMFRWRTSDSA